MVRVILLGNTEVELFAEHSISKPWKSNLESSAFIHETSSLDRHLGKPVAFWFVTGEKSPFETLNVNPGNGVDPSKGR
jgi:hypothetical protein